MTAWLKRLAYLLILLVVLGATIFMTMPVQFMAVQFGLPESVRVGHLSGTVWAGRAADVAYLGPLGKIADKDKKMDLSWRWCPGWERGLAAACLNVDSPLLQGEGTLGYSVLGNDWTVSEARLLARVRDYPVEIESFRSDLEGEGRVHIESLSLGLDDPRLLTGLRANGEVNGLRAAGIALGDYLWRADTGSGGELASEFSGGTDKFKIKGQAFLGLADRGYRYTAEMSSEDRGLLEMLKGKAQKAEGGKLVFSGDGRLGGKLPNQPPNQSPNQSRGKPRSEPPSKPPSKSPSQSKPAKPGAKPAGK